MPKITKEQALAELQRRAESKKGFTGIAKDVGSSLESAPEALGQMITSIPQGVSNVANYASSNNPAETLANVGAGGVESGAGLLSAPQVLMRYLSKKFPALGKRLDESSMGGMNINNPTFSEGLSSFEQQHGLQPQSEQEASVRNAGGLLFGGGLLKRLPGALSRTGAITGEQAGRGGDPVHAALLGAIGETVGKAPWNKAKDVPRAAVDAVKSIPDAVKAIPEFAGEAAASGLETVADAGTKMHIPGMQPTLGALGAYLKHISVKPEKAAQKKLFSDMSSADLPKINERMEAAKRLGLGYLTPAEALVSPFEAAKQGTVGRTSTGSKLLFEKGKQRSGTEGTAINTLLDTIYDEKELKPEMKAAYKETMSESVPQEFINTFSSDPIIEEAINQLHNDPIYRKSLGIQKGSKESPVTPSNSFEYWDHVKRVLGDMEESNSAAAGRKPFKKSTIARTRREMVDAMDAIKPEYKTARNISEREFTRKKLEDVFDKKTMTINNFKNILGSKKKLNEVMDKLKAYPEAQQQLNDMKMLFGETGDLIPNDLTLRGATALKRTGMSTPRNKLDALKQELDEKYGKEHDVATVNLMTDPEWVNKFVEFLNKKGK